MQINVLLFAGVADAVGKRNLRLNLPEKATVQTLIDRLATEYPVAADLIRHSVIALNQDYAEENQFIRPGDEVALIPPVSGGEEKQPTPLLFITEEPLSADHLICEVSNPSAGAVLTFAGIVREYTYGQRTVALEYEAYAPMALRKMEEIVGRSGSIGLKCVSPWATGLGNWQSGRSVSSSPSLPPTGMKLLKPAATPLNA